MADDWRQHSNTKRSNDSLWKRIALSASLPLSEWLEMDRTLLAAQEFRYASTTCLLFENSDRPRRWFGCPRLGWCAERLEQK